MSKSEAVFRLYPATRILWLESRAMENPRVSPSPPAALSLTAIPLVPKEVTGSPSVSYFQMTMSLLPELFWL